MANDNIYPDYTKSKFDIGYSTATIRPNRKDKGIGIYDGTDSIKIPSEQIEEEIVLGGGFIENQFTTIQAGNFWISGEARIDTQLYLGTVAIDNTETKLLTWNSSDKKVEYRDISSIASSSLYIQNQFASAQNPSTYWISGTARVDGNVLIGGPVSGSGRLQVNYYGPAGENGITIADVQTGGGAYSLLNAGLLHLQWTSSSVISVSAVTGVVGFSNTPNSGIDFQGVGNISWLYIGQYGGVVINETGNSAGSVRIEGDTDINLFYSDAINDKVYIGHAASLGDYKFQVTGSAILYGSSPRLRFSDVSGAAASLGVSWDGANIFLQGFNPSVGSFYPSFIRYLGTIYGSNDVYLEINTRLNFKAYGGPDDLISGNSTTAITGAGKLLSLSNNSVEKIHITNTGSLWLNDIPHATTDTDKYLVSDTGIIKYRTGSELLGDLSEAFIQNQFASVQTADYWITGQGKLQNDLTVRYATTATVGAQLQHSPYLYLSSSGWDTVAGAAEVANIRMRTIVQQISGQPIPKWSVEADIPGYATGEIFSISSSGLATRIYFSNPANPGAWGGTLEVSYDGIFVSRDLVGTWGGFSGYISWSGVAAYRNIDSADYGSGTAINLINNAGLYINSGLASNRVYVRYNIDASNYMATVVSATGFVTHTIVGSAPGLKFTGAKVGINTDPSASNVQLKVKSGGTDNTYSAQFVSSDEVRYFSFFYVSGTAQLEIGDGTYSITLKATGQIGTASATDIYFTGSGGLENLRSHVYAGVTINEGARSDVDLRVEGFTNANLLFTDASEDKVYIGTNTSAGSYIFQTNGNVYFNGTGRFNDDVSIIKAQDAVTQFSVNNANNHASAYTEIGVSSNSANFNIGKYSPTKTAYKIFSGGDGWLYNATRGDIAILNDYASGNIKFAAGASSTTQVTINTVGEVLVNVTDQGDYKLQVAGGVYLDVTSKTLKIIFGSDAGGDMYYRNSSGNFVRIGIGSEGYFLSVSANVPTWSVPNRLVRITVNDANHTMTDSNYLIGYTNLTTERTVTLISAGSFSGRYIIIKDESGKAGTYNIVISGTVDGSTSTRINTNYGCIMIYSDGSAYFRIL